jgi:DNA-binding HxlR family transcriptional regulator
MVDVRRGAIQRDVLARGCMSRSTFENLTSKWSGLVLLALHDDDLRFNALRRRVEGVSEKMLSQTLQLLERDGMINREVISTAPPGVEYSLTRLGEQVADALRSFADVLEANADDVRKARKDYDVEHGGSAAERTRRRPA